MEIVENMSRLEAKVYPEKPTDTGLLLHYQSHVRYGQSLLKTMLNRAFKLSSNWQLLHQEYNVIQYNTIQYYFSPMGFSKSIYNMNIRL